MTIQNRDCRVESMVGLGKAQGRPQGCGLGGGGATRGARVQRLERPRAVIRRLICEPDRTLTGG
jgi:hypothetical protein